jgi:hypothetical protein
MALLLNDMNNLLDLCPALFPQIDAPKQEYCKVCVRRIESDALEQKAGATGSRNRFLHRLEEVSAALHCFLSASQQARPASITHEFIEVSRCEAP